MSKMEIKKLNMYEAVRRKHTHTQTRAQTHSYHGLVISLTCSDMGFWAFLCIKASRA